MKRFGLSLRRGDVWLRRWISGGYGARQTRRRHDRGGIVDARAARRRFFGSVAARVVQLLIAAKLRRRHALDREELSIEIRQIVKARLEADIGHAQVIVREQLAPEIDSHPVHVLHERQPGMTTK